MFRTLGWPALALAATGLLCACLPAPGMYLAMGLGIFAAAAGWVGYQRRQDPGPARLAGAGAMTVAVITLVLAVTRYGLTLAALDRLERML